MGSVMAKIRCQVWKDGKQCLLAAIHVGVVACRFSPKAMTVQVQQQKAQNKIPMSAQQCIRAAKKELRQPVQAEEWHCSIPLIPPSVNHYKLPKRGGKGFYVSKEAKAFQAAVASLTTGSIKKDWYYITITIFLGFNQKGDADNFNKVILDGLVKARIITTDARVKNCNTFVERDALNPSTEITIV